MSTRLRTAPTEGLSFDQTAWWGADFRRAQPRSIVSLIRGGTLDAELAGLLWLLVEARLPVLVAAAPQFAGKTTLLTALLDFLPPTAHVIQLRGFAEEFDWLPEAARLGWRGSSAGSAAVQVTPATAYLLASELSAHLPAYTWGEQARVALRAASLGYEIGATLHADSLEGVFAELQGRDVRLTDDELSHLGVVLLLRIGRGTDGSVWRRIGAAHYIRPTARDVHGHVQRLPPAVLATWAEATDGFEHFAWGVTAELAERTGRTPSDFATEQARRTDLLTGLAAAGVDDLDDVRSAIDAYHLAPAVHRH